MSSHYTLPPQQSVWVETKNTIKRSYIFYALLAIALLSIGSFPFNFFDIREWFIIPIMLCVGYVGYVFAIAKNAFWKSFAEVNNWNYTRFTLGKSVSREKGLMFQEGRAQAIDREIIGKIDNRDFRIASYRFTTGTGKNSTTHFFTFVEFQFSGTFQHLYLNHHKNTWDVSFGTGERIPLPGVTESHFSLYSPEGRGKEIEALTIFSVDIIETLFSHNYPYDIEFVDGKMIIFMEKDMTSAEDINRILGDALEIKDLFKKQLDGAK
jgi:hypothetical protein